MDHRNLQYFRELQNLNHRQAQWLLFLNRFDYSLHHRPGVSMGEPYGLSCHPNHGDESEDNKGMVLLSPGSTPFTLH